MAPVPNNGTLRLPLNPVGLHDPESPPQPLDDPPSPPPSDIDEDEDDEDPASWFDDEEDDGIKGQDIVYPDAEDFADVIRVDESRIPYSTFYEPRDSDD